MLTMKAYSYIRMSTEKQLQGNSLARQLNMAREYAKENGWELVEDLYQDIGRSAFKGKNATEGKLGVFIQALEAGKIPKGSVLIVESLDRLSRQSPTKAFNQLTKLLEFGLEIHTLFDRQVFTSKSLNDPGLLFSSIGQMLRAHSESETKSLRLKKSWENKRSIIDEKILTATCPKWLKPKPDKSGFEIIEDRAVIVKRIFDLCIDENMGVYSITKFLNKNRKEYPSFSTPQKKNRISNHSPIWQMSYVSKILNNPAVHGQFQPAIYNEGLRSKVPEIYPDYYPAVIDSDRFLLAKARISQRAQRKGGRKGDAFPNLFSKLLKCGHCNGLVRLIDKGTGPKGGKYLQCSSSHSNGHCSAMAWRYLSFEDAFLKYVAEISIEDVFKRTDQISEVALLKDKLMVNQQKQKQFSILIENLVDNLSQLSPQARKAVNANLETKVSNLEDLKKQHDKIISKLRELEALSPSKVHEELVSFIKTSRQSTSESAVTLRRNINKSLLDLLDHISLFPFSGEYLPFDEIDKLTTEMRKQLHVDGYRSEDAINELFLSKAGKNVLNRIVQYFVLSFKNGEEKIVHPYLKNSIKANSDERNSLNWKIRKKTKKSSTKGGI